MMQKSPSSFDWVKKAWGVGTPRGTRAAAWMVAIGVFGTWYYLDHRQEYAAIKQSNENNAKKSQK